MKTDYDVIVIGSGPAGVAAAIYLKRANLNVVIIEKDAPGGQILKTSIIENYPGFNKITGPDLAVNFYNQVTELGISYEFGEVKEIIDCGEYKKVKCDKKEYTSKTIILALGRKPKTLENSTFNTKGISYCSLCDGPLYKNEDVAIVGGGNSALEEALYLSEICNKVTLINRSSSLKGDNILKDKILNRGNIEVLYNGNIEKFNNTSSSLESLDLNVNGKIKNIKVKACFVFIGYEPATNFLKNLGILDKIGYVEVDSRYETKIKGIYAAGDIVKKDAYQIVTAVSDGALAAVSCIKDLS